jgi:hypothetical protein
MRDRVVLDKAVFVPFVQRVQIIKRRSLLKDPIRKAAITRIVTASFTLKYWYVLRKGDSIHVYSYTARRRELGGPTTLVSQYQSLGLYHIRDAQSSARKSRLTGCNYQSYHLDYPRHHPLS